VIPEPTNDVELPAPLTRETPRKRFVLVWAAVWAVVGCAVACAIVLTTDVPWGPALRLSVLLAEVVGLTALISARLVFPLFSRMPYSVSLLLQILTLMSGTVFGSIAAAYFYPLLSLNEWRIVGAIVLTNAVIGVA